MSPAIAAALHTREHRVNKGEAAQTEACQVALSSHWLDLAWRSMHAYKSQRAQTYSWTPELLPVASLQGQILKSKAGV